MLNCLAIICRAVYAIGFSKTICSLKAGIKLSVLYVVIFGEGVVVVVEFGVAIHYFFRCFKMNHISMCLMFHMFWDLLYQKCIRELRERIADGIDPTELHEPQVQDYNPNHEQGTSNLGNQHCDFSK